MEHGQYRKNDVVTLTIEDIGSDGEGIGKSDGYTLFVKDAVIGDTVEARITKCKKNYGYARVEKVVTPSSFRVEPKCRFHRQCGGCQIQAMCYERQLAYKADKVRNNLLRIGDFSAELLDEIMEPVVGMEEPWHYRNKAQFPVGYDRDGHLVAGFYAGRTHNIIANTDCALGAPENRLILEAVLSYMRENGVSAYREKDGTGLVRHVLIRTGFATGEIMVCLVINGKKLPAEEKLVETLREIAPAGEEAQSVRRIDQGQLYKAQTERMPAKRIVSISVSVNEARTNVIMGQEIRVLWGSERITDSIGIIEQGSAEAGQERITFSISPLSFYQVNPRQTEKLYGLAVEYAGLTGKETVWDLYCGIGTISLFMAKRAKKVYGVEVVPQAIEDAQENARLNGIENVEFYVGKAEEVLPAFYGKKSKQDDAVGEVAESAAADTAAAAVAEMMAGSGVEPAQKTDAEEQLAEEKRHPDVIVVDPPRKGCDEQCLATMLAMRPQRIVYVSCDSATLARDLKVLCGGGYELKKVRMVDQFGHTVHVEIVVLLSHKSPDGVISVEVEFGEGEGKVPLDAVAERTKKYQPKPKITYKMI